MGNGPVDTYAWSDLYRINGRWHRIDRFWGNNGCYRGTGIHQ